MTDRATFCRRQSRGMGWEGIAAQRAMIRDPRTSWIRGSLNNCRSIVTEAGEELRGMQGQAMCYLASQSRLWLLSVTKIQTYC